MKKIAYSTLAALLLCASSSFAAIQLKWNATANQTKYIYSISGSYSVNWGDGTTDSNLSHTYSAAGNYTVEVSGSVTEFDLRGDGANGESGVTDLSITETDKSLATLNIWANSSLTSLDISKAISLSSLDITLIPVATLDLSKNTALQKLDMKRCASISTLVLPESFPSLTTVDVNNSSLPACQLNALFKALPSASGTIYSVGCTGDATSDPTIATNKGWTFGNGGAGDGSAVCEEPLTAVSNVSSSLQSDNYVVLFNGCESATSYSVKVLSKEATDCNAEFYTSTNESCNVPSSAVDLENSTYHVYSIKGTKYVEAGPFKFTDSATGNVEVKSHAWSVYTGKSELVVVGIAAGDEIKVYGISGEVVAVKFAAASEVRFNVPSGVYIVRKGAETEKVVVK